MALTKEHLRVVMTGMQENRIEELVLGANLGVDFDQILSA